MAQAAIGTGGGVLGGIALGTGGGGSALRVAAEGLLR